MIKQSFSPIIGKEPTMLILGSLPGDLSIKMNQYYAHPRNRFWQLMFKIFDRNYSEDYTERIQLIKDNNIVLWDVTYSAIREGSMDSNIKDEVLNLIQELLDEHQTINKILFNGKKSEQLFMKNFERNPSIHYFSLPSTSPANAKFSTQDLIKIWKEAISY